MISSSNLNGNGLFHTFKLQMYSVPEALLVIALGFNPRKDSAPHLFVTE
jgi:hypothetical protein